MLASMASIANEESILRPKMRFFISNLPLLRSFCLSFTISLIRHVWRGFLVPAHPGGGFFFVVA